MSSNELAKTFKLPLLPGNTCGEEMLRRNFRKTQLLSGKIDKPIPRPGIPLDFDSTDVLQSPTKASEDQAEEPSLDRRVLRYYGFYTERVPESPLEKSRVRKVVLHYFLEDDTMSVSEPRVDNSGISFQGSMVKRHQIPRADGRGAITFDQLAVGQTVAFYGREFALTDCDRFTREFMASLGVEMPKGSSAPLDDFTASRAKKPMERVESMSTTINASGMKVKLSTAEIRATKQFLQNDRKVLRFRAVWDDTRALYGRKHYFTLYYFLSEDSIEVVEKLDNNSGQDPFPSFIRRRKIVKPRDVTKFEHHGTDLTFKGRSATEYYTDADLRIGSEVVVFGRTFLIYDYDQYTQQYLTETFGVTDHTPLENVFDPKPEPAKRIPPPYNGYGDEEDSLASWRSLDLKPPRKDGSKFAKYGDNVVKFALKLENGIATDEIRKFVLTCYLVDDSIAIFEPVQRNSGIVGGKFLQRTKLKNPVTGKNYAASDLFVGCHVVISGHPFVVLATDQRSLTYMESNPDTFDKSNVAEIAARIQAMMESSGSGLAQALAEADTVAPGVVDFKVLCDIFRRLNLPISEQEVLTALRYIDSSGEKSISYEEFAARLLPAGCVVGKTNRQWQEIYAAMKSEKDGIVTAATTKAKQAQSDHSAKAALAARLFLEAYEARRQLFHSAFRFITDYTVDNKIGSEEFRHVVTAKLNLAIPAGELDALLDTLFPAKVPRLDYEELLRIFANNSNLPYNLKQVRDGTC